MKPESTFGVICAGGAFLLWGLVPIYWKLLVGVSAAELLCHRIVWGAPILVVMIAAGRGWWAFRALGRDRRTLRTLALSTVLISVNWFTFMWAVNHDYVLQASLGYYINPLVSVLLGFLVLGERLRRWQWFAVGLAAFAVVLLTARLGQLPWIALVLAFSFGLYGLLRKTVKAEAVTGLAFEIGLLVPIAVFYLIRQELAGVGSFGHSGVGHDLLLIAAGPVTVIPLVWFTMGARRLRLATVGILQYVTPTGQFLLAVLLYREPFSAVHLVAFTCIWIALVVYTVEGRVRARKFGAPA